MSRTTCFRESKGSHCSTSRIGRKTLRMTCRVAMVVSIIRQIAMKVNSKDRKKDKVMRVSRISNRKDDKMAVLSIGAQVPRSSSQTEPSRKRSSETTQISTPLSGRYLNSHAVLMIEGKRLFCNLPTALLPSLRHFQLVRVRTLSTKIVSCVEIEIAL